MPPTPTETVEVSAAIPPNTAPKSRKPYRARAKAPMRIFGLRIEAETMQRVTLLRRMLGKRDGNAELRRALRAAVEAALGAKLSAGLLATENANHER